MQSDSGDDDHDHGGDCGFDFASNKARITLDRGHDRATIGPRSRVDPGSSRKMTAIR